MRERVDEFGPRVERLRAPDLDALVAGISLGLDVEVVEDLEMIGDETDRADQHVSAA